MIHTIWHLFLSLTGADNQASIAYGLWSGFIPCLALTALIAGAWKHINCHASGCPRLGFHHINGTTFKVCSRHHPRGGNTVEDIHNAYYEARA